MMILLRRKARSDRLRQLRRILNMFGFNLIEENVLNNFIQFYLLLSPNDYQTDDVQDNTKRCSDEGGYSRYPELVLLKHD